jgi:streptogramin lyase
MALDERGRLWFTEVFGNRIGVLENERFFEFELPQPGSQPGGITIDSAGNLYFSEQAGNRIGKIPFAVGTDLWPNSPERNIKVTQRVRPDAPAPSNLRATK